MWVRKPQQVLELEAAAREAARLSLWRPLLAAAVLTGASLALYALGIRVFVGGVVVASGQSVRSPILFALSGLILFLGSLWYFHRRQRASGTSPFASEAKATLCNRCHESSLAAAGSRCECGGTHEPLEDWEWIAEDEETPKPDSESI